MSQGPIDLRIRQFSEAWRLTGAGAPGYVREARDGLECIFSGLPIAFFNVGLLTGQRVSAAYAMDLEAGKAMIGKPACASAVMMVDRYVALVATHRSQQRRGYADAAMRRSLENAASAQGERPTFLHATDAGKPVYQRMGYRTVAAHRVFLEKRCLEAHDAAP